MSIGMFPVSIVVSVNRIYICQLGSFGFFFFSYLLYCLDILFLLFHEIYTCMFSPKLREILLILDYLILVKWKDITNWGVKRRYMKKKLMKTDREWEKERKWKYCQNKELNHFSWNHGHFIWYEQVFLLCLR